MSTVRDIITLSLQELGVLAAGEVATSADAADGLSTLNRLMDSWQAQRLQIFQTTRTTWTIAANDPSYTLGTGGDINILRPAIAPNQVNFLDTSKNPNQEYVLTLLTDDQYASIPIKTQTSTYPTAVYVNPTYPLATLTLWPVPTSTTLTGVFYCPQAVAQFTGLSQTVSLPPGYERMIVKNLALELAPLYSRQPSPATVEQAKESMSIVKRANYRMKDLAIDPGAIVQGYRYWRGGYNIFTG